MIAFEFCRELGAPFSKNMVRPHIRIAMSGISLGSCSFKTEEGRANAAQLIDYLGVRHNFAKPSLGFTNCVVPFQSFRYSFLTGYSGDVPTADGVFIDKERAFDGCQIPRSSSVIIPNADCPVAIVSAVGLYQPVWCVVVCHVGLKTFDHEHTLLDNAYEAIVTYMGAIPFQLGVITGFGARHCCYGLNEKENSEMLGRLGARFDLGISSVRHGPRMGQQGIDIENLVVQNIREFAPYASVEMVGICTSCFGFVDKNVHGFGTFFSNLRDDRKINPRNGLVITVS